jgi:beta-aspartyl-peptidase (threonine type)
MRMAKWLVGLAPVLLLIANLARAADPPAKVVLIIHGGAGAMSEAEMAKAHMENGGPVTRQEMENGLAASLEAGYRTLAGKTSIDAVEAAIRVMEDSELFNAGRGAVFTHDGRVEMDAAIMSGQTGETPSQPTGKRDVRKRAGAVSGVTHVKNPISAARAVMEMPGGRHVLLVGEGAERYVLRESVARQYHIENVSNVYFWTGRRVQDIRNALARDERRERNADSGGRADLRFGTVGAVALDSAGNLAAGTSTGGVNDKWTGRVGDCPILGAGTYADNRACGVSCSGTGELFMRHCVAHDVAARIVYAKTGLAEAAQVAIQQLPDEPGGVGGLIALDHEGHATFAVSPKTNGMYRGYVTEAGDIYVAVYAKDEYRLVRRVNK